MENLRKITGFILLSLTVLGSILLIMYPINWSDYGLDADVRFVNQILLIGIVFIVGLFGISCFISKSNLWIRRSLGIISCIVILVGILFAPALSYAIDLGIEVDGRDYYSNMSLLQGFAYIVMMIILTLYCLFQFQRKV